MRLAVLVDADNVSYTCANKMMAEIQTHGTPLYKRIYGDWAQPSVASWKAFALMHGMVAVQQHRYTRGKNATDIALTIDAMDILYRGQVEGFVLVSSDSDFTPLALRIKEQGLRVIGIGQTHTPKALIAACDTFAYLSAPATQPEVNITLLTDSLKESRLLTREINKQESNCKAPTAESGRRKTVGTEIENDLRELIHATIIKCADPIDGWSYVSAVAAAVRKAMPSFHPQAYGFKNVSRLLNSLADVQVAQLALRRRNSISNDKFVRSLRDSFQTNTIEL